MLKSKGEYSKDRSKIYVDDSLAKQRAATPEMRKAIEQWVIPKYQAFLAGNSANLSSQGS